MANKFVAKPIEVEAFQAGVDNQPVWYLKALREKRILILPAKGTIVAKTASGQINMYDPKTFNALFETKEEAKDLNKDGEIDTREKAIAAETKKKRAPRKKVVKKEEE